MAKKTETKTEGKPEPRPAAPAMTPGKLRRFLQSRDMSARLEPDDLPVTPGPRGPMTGETSPLSELARTATSEELAEFAAIVKAKRAATESAWMRCDNPACGFVGRFRATVAGGACMLCNFRSLRAGGHLQEMDAQAVAYYQETKATKDAEIRTRMELASLAAQNMERATGGLVPLTLEAYRAENRRDFERRAGEQARMDAQRAGRDARVAALPQAPRPDVELVQGGANAPIVGPVRRPRK